MAVLQLLSAVAAGNNPPTHNSATVGVRITPDGSVNVGLGAKKAHLILASTAGSDTLTADATLWGMVRLSSSTFYWVELLELNGGESIAEADTDRLRYSEVVENLGAFERVYLQIDALGGTDTAVSAWLVGIED